MKAFLDLIEKMEQTKSSKEKKQWMKRYFESFPPKECVWALFFLSGKRLKRCVGGALLWQWCLERLDIPEWLAVECYATVGDLAETIAHLLSGSFMEKEEPKLSLAEWMDTRILPLIGQSKEKQKESLFAYWDELGFHSLFLLNKIITGGLRIGVSHALTIQALSCALNIPKETLTLRLMGNWFPTEAFYETLKSGLEQDNPGLNPYPFYLASPVNFPLDQLGDPQDFFAEWKWDGIRAQCISRGKECAIWSRGNELISHQFPELMEALKKISEETVLDGEILAYQDDAPKPFSSLQKRLGRKNVSSSMQRDNPVIYMLYDILEWRGVDLRKRPLLERRALLEENFKNSPFKISPLLAFSHWEMLEEKRIEAPQSFTEGVMIKKKESIYLSGRYRGGWWKFKSDPKTIDAVLIYAEPGHGWRANLYTDYTFGVWHHGELIPIAKAYSGLNLEEIRALDHWIRRSTLEKFGPVRRVKPEQVFEIAFEGISPSKRHKSQVALRFPRISRWRQDKPVEECSTLDQIKKEFHL